MDARKMLWELPRDVFAQSHVIWVFASALSLFVTTSVQVVLLFWGKFGQAVCSVFAGGCVFVQVLLQSPRKLLLAARSSPSQRVALPCDRGDRVRATSRQLPAVVGALSKRSFCLKYVFNKPFAEYIQITNKFLQISAYLQMTRK